MSSSNGGKPSSSSESAEATVQASSAADGFKDDATTVAESSTGVLNAASAGFPAGFPAKKETTSGGTGTSPPGAPAFKDEQAKDPSLPWSASAEPSGPVFGDRTAGPAKPPAKPSAKPFGTGEGSAGASSAPASARSGSSGSVGSAFKNRVNDVMRPGKASAGGKSPRKAHLQVSRLEPWSVMKFSFVMSLVCFIVLLVAVAVIYMILSGLGVFDQIVQTINELTQDKNAAKSSSFDAATWFSFPRIFGYTVLVGALNVLLITALATVWSVIYNIAADFVGGVEVTLKEAD